MPIYQFIIHLKVHIVARYYKMVFLTSLRQYLASFTFYPVHSQGKGSEDNGKKETVTKLIKKSDTKPIQFPLYTMADVSDHCELCDCWIVLWDKVYDITEFIKEVSLMKL